MREEKFPLTDDVKIHFPNANLVRIWTGTKLYATEREGKFYLIMDDGSIVDLVADSDQAADQALVKSAVKLYEFDSETKRETYLNQKYPYSVLTDPSLSFDERWAAWETELAKQVKAKRKPRYCEG